MDKTLNRGREAFRVHEWDNAFVELSKVDKEIPLEPEDLELVAMAAHLTGRASDCFDYLARAHSVFLKQEKVERAVRSAFWLGFILLNKGEMARGGGWISRARRLMDENRSECVEQGYLLLPIALRCLGEGDAKGALAVFEQAGKIAEQFRDPDLMTLSRLGRGQALIRQRNKLGLEYLDEAMAAVESGEVSPIVVGIVYCAVIETCLEIFDLRRAHEWTEALSNWCDSQPQMVPFKGQCLIRRSEIMQLNGTWQKAIEEAFRASELLTQPDGEPAAGAAYYQLGELYRLRGEFAKAEEAYRQAIKWGRNPQPGLALLRLGEGQLETACSSIKLAMDEAKNFKNRSRMLSAYTEIMLAANFVKEARKAADELVETANELDAPILHALAAHASGYVLLKEGDAISALEKLRQAEILWNKINVPYETGRARLLIGMACREIGDEDTAEMELEAAKSIFQKLQAKPDQARTEKFLHGRFSKPHGLTSRELQVIGRIANGKSNKDIANELFISERTVERHISNIFGKLNVSSRSSVAAYAYKHQLV